MTILSCIIHIFRNILLAFFIFHGFCQADKAGHYTFMKDATLAPKLASFDYIIIGGGTAGCALAATLSQNATVLVLERGGSPYDNPTATDIGNFANTLLNNTPNSWSQLFISEDGVYNTRPVLHTCGR
ncbi:Protein HOTHEAD [Cardamine amara subsp. amara]|uniref:Protein HOTHEAD n=1 Tax=Cardamine amara subsp. amara TaxID=228776 RepID=A0ABD1APJ9_CARAN